MTANQSTVRVLERTAASADVHGPLALADTAHSGAREPAEGRTAGSEPATGESAIPPRVGRFLVIRTLGAGGMGVVAEAYDPELDRRIALKLLKHGRGGDSQARLMREAQAMARLSHPNVVQVYDVGLVGDQVFIAMELVRGQTLGTWLEDQTRHWRDVVRVFLDAGRGLAAAHAAGLVHRDFKPDNELIAADGRVRVADFGLAREGHGEPSETNPGERKLLGDTLTATGAIMGTPVYMSPEQHRGAAAGPASDVFSFSVALFEALHGARPFAGDTLTDLARNVETGAVAVPPPGRRVPAWLDAAVRRGLATRPAERPEFPALLHALARDPAVARRRWLGGAALGLGAAALGFALQGNLAAETCTGGPARIAEVYDDAAAATIGARLAELPPAERDAGSRRVLDGLSTYAREWSDMHRDACLAHGRGEHSSTLFDARTRCLEERRAALAEAVTAIADARTAPRDAAMVVAKLPALAPCADVPSLTAELPLPADAAAAATIDAQRRELARARVVATAGRAREAIDRAAAVRTHAERLDYLPLVAEARLVEGRVAMEALLWPEAAEALTQAHVAATAARHDAVAAESRARTLWLDGAVFGRLDDALAGRPLAEAWIARLGRRRDLQALLAGNIGVLHLYRGDRAAARERFAAALTYAESDPARDPVDHARGTLSNAARTTDDPAARDRLFQEADDLLARHLGPAHHVSLTQRMTRADYTDDPAAAHAHLAAACPVLRERRADVYDVCVECYVRLGHAAAEAGRADAPDLFQSVGTCLDGPVLEVDRPAMAAQRALADGHAALLRGDPAGALARLAEAEAAYAPMAAQWHIAPILADVELATARALVAQDRRAEAVPRLERAIAALEPAASRDHRGLPRYLLAGARATLADALWPPAAAPSGPERDRALHSLRDAEAFYRAAGPGYAARLAELAAWRMTRAPSAD
jgi:predicted Ser/Thr protein kinase